MVPDPPEDDQLTDSSSDHSEETHTPPILSPSLSLTNIFHPDPDENDQMLRDNIQDDPDPDEEDQMLEDNIYDDPLPGTSLDQHANITRQFDPFVPDTNISVTSSSEDGDTPSGPTAKHDH